MIEFKKSKKYVDGWETIKTSKFSHDTLTILILKNPIEKNWKIKVTLSCNMFGEEEEVIKESQWIKFKTKKSAMKYGREHLWNY